MKKQEIYSIVLDDSRQRFKDKFFANLASPTFPWEKLAMLVCEEDGPLAVCFEEQVIAFGKLFVDASRLYEQVTRIEEMETHGSE